MQITQKNNAPQELLATIQIYEMDILLSTNNTTKVITMNDLAKLIKYTVFHDTDIPQSDVYKVLNIVTSSDYTQYKITSPMQTRTIRIEAATDNIVEQEIEVPQMLFYVRKDRAGKWSFEKVFAYEGELHSHTTLKVAPFSNTYSNGSICHGSVSVITDCPFDYIEKGYFQSLFSMHLANTPYKDGVLELYRKTGGKNLFPYLTEIGDYRSVA